MLTKYEKYGIIGIYLKKGGLRNIKFMYDWELHNYLKERNYNLNHLEYDYVCKTCPQLNHIKYEPYEDLFKMWSNDGEYFEFKVYYDKNLEKENL